MVHVIGFGLVSAIIYFAGVHYSDKSLEFIGFMLPACTFLPFPADTYVLYASQFYSPLYIGILGGLINAVSVIWEKYFFRMVIRQKQFDKFVMFFNEFKYGRILSQNLFVLILVSAFSFIPFEPFRLIAITHNYDDKRYFIATFLGRGFRYFILASISRQFIKHDIIMFAITISAFVFIYGTFRSYQKRGERKDVNVVLEE